MQTSEMKKIFILNGSGGVGKDTFVDIVGEMVPTKHISIIDKVKKAAKFFGWDNDKSDVGRRFLSDLKDLTDGYNNFNMRYVIEEIDVFIKNDSEHEFLFVDVRESAQIKLLTSIFKDALTVIVTNKNVPKIMTNRADSGVFDMKYNYNVKNDGTISDLVEEAKKFVFLCRGKDVLNNEVLLKMDDDCILGTREPYAMIECQTTDDLKRKLKEK